MFASIKPQTENRLQEASAHLQRDKVKLSANLSVETEIPQLFQLRNPLAVLVPVCERQNWENADYSFGWWIDLFNDYL